MSFFSSSAQGPKGRNGFNGWTVINIHQHFPLLFAKCKAMFSFHIVPNLMRLWRIFIYRKALLISTYVFSGLATEQVLIFGTVLTFGGGGGYDKDWGVKNPARKESVQSSAYRRQHTFLHVSVIMHILPGYRGTYIRRVCTFGALQPGANFSKSWRGT